MHQNTTASCVPTVGAVEYAIEYEFVEFGLLGFKVCLEIDVVVHWSHVLIAQRAILGKVHVHGEEHVVQISICAGTFNEISLFDDDRSMHPKAASAVHVFHPRVLLIIPPILVVVLPKNVQAIICAVHNRIRDFVHCSL